MDRNIQRRAPNLITAGTTEAGSTPVDLSQTGWGTIKFPSDPGTVTVYNRSDSGDTWTVAQDRDGANLTFTVTPNQAKPLKDDIFYYNEIKFVASTEVTNVRLSFKA